ncbi:MAG: acyl-ACP--UDP-N-acetylglucosamine O-acyltransferase [Planctomycetota bacterium]
MSKIHSTAIVHPKAQLDSDVEVGPYSIIDENVVIGSGTKVSHHSTVTGHTVMGKDNVVFPYAAIGTAPQDLTYRGEPTRLTIGDNNTFREFVTVHCGTMKDKEETILGNDNLLMAYSHVGHDSIIGSHTILSNGVQLGGHVRVEDYAVLGGLAGVHHFVTIGRHSFVGGIARVIQDVPPFMIAEGHPAKVRAPNSIGLERRGFSQEKIEAIEKAFRLIWHSKKPVQQSLKYLQEKYGQHEEIIYLVKFLQNMQNGKYGRYREITRKVPAR